MGYNTEYSLVIDNSQVKDEIEKKKQSEIEEIQQSNISDELKMRLIKDVKKTYNTDIVYVDDVIDLLNFDPFGNKCKWYDHTEDMRKISEKYQNVIFSLYGNGEEDGDMWVKYFMNGKVQYEKAVITYANFDPKKLAVICTSVTL